jgi:hypothetical protein
MPLYTKGLKLYQNKLRYSLRPIDKSIIPNHINSSTSNKLVNKNPSTDRLVYSSQNPYGGVGDAGIWVRNPNCWINGVSKWYTSSGGPFITQRYNQINSIIESLSPGQGYSLSPIDLDLVYDKYS